MALINFSRESFIDDVISGKKRCTIRSMRKHPIEKGEMLYLYTGLRTSHARKLRETTCTRTEQLLIKTASNASEAHPIDFYVNDRLLSPKSSESLARKVGFTSVPELYAYFSEHYTFPFHGQVIEWE